VFAEYYPGEEWARGYSRVRALAGLGRIEAIEPVLDQCLTLQWSEVDPSWILLTAVRALRKHGHHDEAQRIADRAVALYRGRSAPVADPPHHQWQLLECLYHAERWDEAQSLCAQLAAADPDHVDVLGRLGTLAARRGEEAEARRLFDRLRAVDRPYLWGNHTAWCARIAALLGEQQPAVELLLEAAAQGKHFLGSWPYDDIDLEPLRGYPPFEEFVRPKG
jgi:tetratricopeptide (TPR) repeat protein